MNKILSLILVSTVLLLTSCGKQKSDIQPTTSYNPAYPIDTGLLTHYAFHVGTYWVYRDSITGRVDSFYVYNSAMSKEGIDSRGGGWFVYQVHISEKNTDGTAPSADTSQWDYYMMRNNIKLSSTSVGYPAFDLTYPFLATSSHVDSNYTSYPLNGSTYTNVAEITYNRCRFFLNDSLGIIKMRLNQSDTALPGHVWELQRWHVVRW